MERRALNWEVQVFILAVVFPANWTFWVGQDIVLVAHDFVADRPEELAVEGAV